MKHKIQRLSEGAQPRVLDLFSGCGGLSLGFQRAGFCSVGGIEVDPHAAASYARNFHQGSHQEHFAKARDIRTVDMADFLQVPVADVVTAVDVVIGGPPCPSFTRVGRAKLREVMSHPEAYKLDERTTLYLHALRVIEETKPLTVLIENVPDVLNQGGRSVGDEIAQHLREMGYAVAYTLLNAANYGVPQMRDRFFLLAYALELRVTPRFPDPTHWLEIPRGYEGSRGVALKLLGDLSSHQYFAPPATPHEGLIPAITATDALADLPVITEHLASPQKRGAQRFDRPIPYPIRPIGQKSYAATMRKWPGFESTGELRDHVTRALGPRDLRLFARMKAGDDYPAAHRLAMNLWRQARSKPEELRAYVPPYDPTKFPNKWRKMEPDAPARTLMAHIGKDTYSHIHYDSTQARTITVREAARLQSFPDGFMFSGTMNPAFRQIGNAVPPLLAFQLARHMWSALSSADLKIDQKRSA
jgi:DNA (cytosine-5)-methyltransferase 1